MGHPVVLLPYLLGVTAVIIIIVAINYQAHRQYTRDYSYGEGFRNNKWKFKQEEDNWSDTHSEDISSISTFTNSSDEECRNLDMEQEPKERCQYEVEKEQHRRQIQWRNSFMALELEKQRSERMWEEDRRHYEAVIEQERQQEREYKVVCPNDCSRCRRYNEEASRSEGAYRQSTITITTQETKKKKEGVCKIVINFLQQKHPLLLKLNHDMYNDDRSFLAPDSNGIITFLPEERFRIYCNIPHEYEIIKCVVKDNMPPHFEDQLENIVDIHKRTCKNPGNTIKSSTTLKVHGFDVEKRFIKMFYTLRPLSDKNVHITKHYLSNTMGGYVNFARPSYPIDKPSQIIYNKLNQQSYINNKLGEPSNSIRFINPKSSNYFARGHFVPCKDFIYPVQKKLTFTYENVAPQWQKCNAGNWKTLENSIRNYVSNQNKRYLIYTGTYGDFKINDDVIFLTGHAAIPGFFWKILMEEKQKSGYAFVVINNPYILERTITGLRKFSVECPIPLNWNKDNIGLGLAFCLRLDAFYEEYPHIHETINDLEYYLPFSV